jgi:hypothetical protein
MDETAILPENIDDQSLAGVDAGSELDTAHFQVILAKHIDDGATEDVVANAADNGGRHIHLGKINSDVGSTAADGQKKPLGQHQFARTGQVVDRGANVVGNDDTGTQNVGMRGHESLLSDQRSAISDQRSAISDQRSAISDQRSA